MKPMKNRTAFSLVEVTLAMGVAAFCLLAVFSLLPVGINTNKASIEQTAATNFLTAVASDLQATANPIPRGTQTSARFGIAIPAAGGTVTAAGTPLEKYIAASGDVTATASGARYLLSVWLTPPGSNSRQATSVRLRLTWPAGATAANAAGAVDTVIALDRN